jgi:hypothetical protein
VLLGGAGGGEIRLLIWRGSSAAESDVEVGRVGLGRVCKMKGVSNKLLMNSMKPSLLCDLECFKSF